MRLRLVGMLLIGLVPAGFAHAQGPGGDYGSWGLPNNQQSGVLDWRPPPDEPEADRSGPARFWFQHNYLIWFVRNGGPHVPLVTSDTKPGSLLAGSLASPTVRPLFGDSGFDYHGFSGMRLTLGGWFVPQQSGIEISGFLLEKRSVGFAAGSNAGGQPPLYVTAYNPVLQREDSLIVADPVLGFAGNVAITSALRMWGMEVNGIYRVVQSDRWQIDVTGGFRTLDLAESFTLANDTTDVLTGASTLLADRFATRNQFYGAQAGLRVNSTWGRLTAGAAFELAMGGTHQSVDVTGSTVAPGTPTFPGGFFAEPTNIGHHDHGSFTVIPHVSATLGVQITSYLRALVGYDLLYWNDVARASNQIDRSLNLSQNPILGAGGGTLAGPARPAPLFNRTDFTAHGVSFALVWQY
jgi:hypothetical protein